MEFNYRTRIGVEQTTEIEGLVSKTGPGSFNSSELHRRRSLPFPWVPAHRTTRLHPSWNIICPRPAAGGFFPQNALKDQCRAAAKKTRTGVRTQLPVEL